MQELPNLDNFSKEQLDAVSQMKDLGEFMSFVNEEAIELTDEQLDAVSGGDYGDYVDAAGKACV